MIILLSWDDVEKLVAISRSEWLTRELFFSVMGDGGECLYSDYWMCVSTSVVSHFTLNMGTLMSLRWRKTNLL